jgi:hypothetical protein
VTERATHQGLPDENDVYELPTKSRELLKMDTLDPAVARLQVQRWSELDPTYGAIVEGIRELLRRRSSRGSITGRENIPVACDDESDYAVSAACAGLNSRSLPSTRRA